MSMDRNQANANTIANLTARQSVADAIFISNVNGQIATADALGKTQITAYTNKMVNLPNLYTYFIALGYTVYFPDYANQHAGVWPGLYNQPSNLFGWFWYDYWSAKLKLFGVQNPCRMTIGWSPDQPPPQPPPASGEVQSF